MLILVIFLPPSQTKHLEQSKYLLFRAFLTAIPRV